jgi:hypothetical protein
VRNQAIQEAFVQGAATRKMEKLARSLGIENLSQSQVSEKTKDLKEQAQEFRNRLLTVFYPDIWTDTRYKKSAWRVTSSAWRCRLTAALIRRGGGKVWLWLQWQRNPKMVSHLLQSLQERDSAASGGFRRRQEADCRHVGFFGTS